MSNVIQSHKQTQLLCLWSGPAGISLWMIGFIFTSGFIIPIPPSDTAVEVAAAYANKLNGIRIGLLLTMVGATMTAPMVAVISTQMKRIEGMYSPLSYTQLGLGMCGILLFIIPVMNLQTAAFRPDRSPELIQLANDLGWIPFVGAWCMASLQSVAIALCIFKDKNSEVFPRWAAYFNLWIALLYCPGSLLYFFKDGPFAWDGIFSWWFVVAVFVCWFLVMLTVTRNAILNQQDEHIAAHQ